MTTKTQTEQQATQTEPDRRDYSEQLEGDYSGRPWERQENDTQKSWEAFQYYRDLKSDRAFRKVAEHMDHSGTRYVERWSKKHNWQERARAYDNYLTRKRIKEAEKEYQQKIRDLAEQQRRIHKAAADTALRALKKARNKLQQIEAEEFRVRDIPSLLRASAQIAETAGEMQSRSLGLDKLMDELFENE